MRFLFLTLMLIFITSCYNSNSNVSQVPEYEKMADRITAMTAKKIEAETGLRLCGVGGGAINHIRKLNMSFNCEHAVTMEQGRKLLIYCVNEYLTAINSNEEIRPYLIHYPFTPEDIQIDVFFSKNDQGDFLMGSIAVVTEVDGRLVYRVRQPWPEILEKVHQETYEEAVKILEASSTRQNL